MRAVKNIRSKLESSKRILTEGAKIITLCFGISTLCSAHASALSAQEEVDLQFTFVPSLSISLSDSRIYIDNLTPGNYANSNTIRINVTTNSAFGYTLTATVGNEEDYTSNELINADSKATFSSIDSNAELTLNNFNPNYWGYTTATSVGSSSLYSGLTYNASTIINKTMSSSGRAFREYPGTNTTNFTIGASASSDQLSGEYTNVIGFELIANVDTDVYTFMQDVTKAQLAALLPNIGDTMILTDKRDYNEYQITNIDGTYWMTGNLQITGVVTATLSNFTGADFNISAGSLISGDSYSEARSAYYSDSDHPEYGAYYNYCAASAGTVCNSSTQTDSTVDICPAGWRLPTQAEIQAIANTSGANFNLVTAGYYNGGELRLAGSRGYWWSATASNATGQYILYYNDSWNVDHSGKRYGRSIRCIKADD